MSSTNDDYTPSPLLETSLPLSPPRTPPTTSSLLTVPSSAESTPSMLATPAGSQDTNSLEQNRPWRPSSFTPPQSQQTTPKAQTSSRPLLATLTRSRVQPPHMLTETDGAKPKIRLPQRKLPKSRQEDTTCPFTIPKRSSSLQATQSHTRPAKISKAALQHLRQGHYQRRSSSLSSTSSASSKASILTTIRSSPQNSCKTLLETQAQKMQPPPRPARQSTLSSIRTVNSETSSCYSVPSSASTPLLNNNNVVSDGILHSFGLTPCMIDTTSVELFPSFQEPSSSCSSTSSSTSSSPSTASTLVSTASYPWSYDPTMMMALHNDSAAPMQAAICSSHTSSLDTDTDLPVIESNFMESTDSMYYDCVSTFGTQAEHEQLPFSSDSTASFEGTNQDLYTNTFIPTSSGGAGMLVNTSRLTGRVMRPWN